MTISHHNALKMYVNDDLLYEGQVLIYEDNTCEGIVNDKNSNRNFIFGTFEKNKELDLIIINNNHIENFRAKKTYLKYVGEYRIIKGDEVKGMPFYLIASSLDVDPRDYVWDDTPSHVFEKELDRFKKER